MWGNDGTELVEHKRSVGGTLEEWAAQSDTVGFDSTRDHGQFSGFTHGAAELPDFARVLFRDPGTFGEPVAEYLLEYQSTHYQVPIDDIEDGESDAVLAEQRPLWIDVAIAMGADIHRTQATDNPYESPTGTATGDLEHCLDSSIVALESGQDIDDWADTTQLYCQFAAGWYEGYGGFLVAETLVGTKGLSQGADGVSSADDLRRVLDDADVSSNQAFRAFDGQHTKSGQIGRGLVTDGGNPNIDAPAVRQHLRDDHGIETAGGQKSALDQLEHVDNWQHLTNLSSSEHAVLATRLSKSQDPGATRAFVTELDDIDDVWHLLEETDVATTNRLVDWHVNPSVSRYIDPDLEASDLVQVAKYDDVMKITVVAREVQSDGTTNVLCLSRGTDEYGQQHIIKRHATGEIIRDVDTDFYPVGGPLKRVGLNTISRIIWISVK